MIGYIALNDTDNPGELNLGYCFNFNHHGKGYATEASKAALDYAFLECGTVKLVSGTVSANEPSCRLLANLGFIKTTEAISHFCTTADGEPIQFLGLCI